MKACFFDLDGTLVDSIELIVRCFQHATERHLGVALPRQEVLALIGKPLRPELERLAPGKGMQLIESYREMQFGLHDDLVKPFAEVGALIESLAARNVPLGIVTSKALRGTLAALNLFGETAKHFTTIVTVDDCDRHKPDPTPLLLAADRTSIEPAHCVYVGDTHFDMEAARDAGMTPVGVTWGVAARERLELYTPHVFDTVGDLGGFLTGRLSL